MTGTQSAQPRRRDIDGLRGVAILAVVLFHASPQLLPGGFLGVDVFFVISGYLITGIIARGNDAGTFSIGGFYARRIRRILPALIPVLVFVWGYGWLMLFPDEYRSLGKHIAGGAAFGSNVILWQESGYFDSPNKPLMHLWSLGVEEQFYLLWPLLLVITRKSHRVQLVTTAALGVASFTSFVVLSGSDTDAAFYLSTSRFWELSIGSLLALLELRQPLHSRIPLLTLRDVRKWAVVAGLSVIVFACAVTRGGADATWSMLAATVGAALVIGASEKSAYGMRLLTHPVLVFVGLVSYSLYLWHWPLLSFVSIVERDASALMRLLALCLACILAVLSYRYVEQPFLRGFRGTRAVPVGLVAVLLLCGAIGYATFRAGIAPRSVAYGADRFAGPMTEVWPIDGVTRMPSPERDAVYFSEGDSAHRVLFIGDSTIQQYFPRAQKLHADKHVATRGTIFLTHYGCPPVTFEGRYCRYAGDAIQYANDRSVERVVIGAFWRAYFITGDDTAVEQGDSTQWPKLRPQSDLKFAALEKLIRSFTTRGKAVYLILQAPYGERIDPRLMLQRHLFALGFTPHIEPWDRRELEHIVEPVVARLREIARRTGAHVIDPLDALCDQSDCPTVTPAGDPMYRDRMHLRPSYVAENVTFLDDIIVMTPRRAHVAKALP